MCGIIGVTGAPSALPLILDSLGRLEYRGYDSAGVALQDGGKLWRQRRAGKLAELAGAVGDAPKSASAGIGHTRWATHGSPNERNAHPHVDWNEKLALVHNGIIENYLELGEEVADAGHLLSSQTDTEVLAHLIALEMDKGVSLREAVRLCMARVDGSFSIAVIHTGEPDVIVAARRGSPLIAGQAEGMGLVASDIPALLEHTRDVLIIDDDVVIEVRPDGIDAVTLDGTPITLQTRTIDWDLEAAEKGGYETYMLKEMHEQPHAVADTIRGRLLPDGSLRLDELRLSDNELRTIQKICIVGCGSSYYAGLVAKYALEHWTRVPVEVDIASEFRYRDPVLDAGTLVIGVSQSGESIDTLYAIREAKRQKSKVLTISNVVDSSMARESDAVLYTRAGPEIGVASTKCHLSQIVALELLTLYLAQLRSALFPDEIARHLIALEQLPEKIEAALGRADEIKKVALNFVDVRDFFYLGRGVSYPVALEGALKLKEISYQRAEGYPGGELKHGPIALVTPDTVVVGVATQGHLQQKLLANIEEVRARGATVVLVANEGDDRTASLADHVLWVPKTNELFSPAVDVVPLQLFAYHLATARGNDVDQPRNLAKTVTVE